jgi:hypothetical protein
MRDYTIPFPNYTIFAQSCRFYKKWNVRAVPIQIQFSGLGDLSELKHWLYAKLTWNPDADVDTLIDTYCKACFGPGAKHVREYIDIVEHARLRQRWTWFGCYVQDTSHFLTDEDCVRIYVALGKAAGAAARNPEYDARCRRARLPALSLAIWRYQDMLAPAARMNVKLPTLRAIRLPAHQPHAREGCTPHRRGEPHRWLAHVARQGSRRNRVLRVQDQPCRREGRNLVQSRRRRDRLHGQARGQRRLVCLRRHPRRRDGRRRPDLLPLRHLSEGVSQRHQVRRDDGGRQPRHPGPQG